MATNSMDIVVDRVDWHDANVKAAVAAGRKKASMEAAEGILQDANKHVPYEDGDLERSGRVSQTAVAGTTTAVISYNTAYARRLHENPQYNFKHGREGKWLERALSRAPRQVMATMTNVFAGIFRGGRFM